MGRGFNSPSPYLTLGRHNDVTYASAAIAVLIVFRDDVALHFAAGTIEVLALRHTMQEGVHDGWVFDLCGQTELGLIEARFTPAVALPIRVLPFPITSVVLGHLLGLAVTSRGRHRPFAHGFVDHSNRDTEVGIAVGFVRDVGATLFHHNFDVARNANETRPSSRISFVERSETSVEGSVSVEASGVDVVTEGVVADDTIDAELQTGKTLIEVRVSIPVAIVALGLEVKRTANLRIRDNDVEQRLTSRILQIKAESVIFVLEVNESIVEHIKREISDLVEIGGSELNAKSAEVVTSFVVNSVFGNEPCLVIDQTAVGSVISGDTHPFVTSTTDVVATKELFVNVLGDTGVGLLELKNLFSREKAIEKALDANPVSGHLFAEKLESVALRAGALDDFGFAIARVSLAVGVSDLTERSARIVESTAKAECFLFSCVVQGPRLLLETGEVCRVSDELLHIEVVEIFAALAEETVNLGTTVEI
jgi:hypothetical protein